MCVYLSDSLYNVWQWKCVLKKAPAVLKWVCIRELIFNGWSICGDTLRIYRSIIAFSAFYPPTVADWVDFDMHSTHVNAICTPVSAGSIYNGWSYFPCGSSFSSNMSIGTWFDFFSIHLSWLFNFLCFSESSLVCFPPLSSCLSCGLYPPSGWTCWNPPWERSGAVDWIQCL